MAGTLRGDGLARAQRALAGLQEDTVRLDRERQRFNHSPPPHTSNPSGTTTRSASPISPSEERRQERRIQLAGEHRASEPDKQFSHQISDEKKRIMDADLNRTCRLKIGDDPDVIAHENVKRCWVEQGIWNNKWNQFAYGRWKHEGPLQPESESEMDPEARPPSPLFYFAPKPPQLKRRQSKSADEKRRTTEQRVIREREREASRPYHQFVYQISKERQRIQGEPANKVDANTIDINTRAYENVKNTWTKRGIWNKRWGVLPGMSWKHEQPFEEMVREEMGDDPVPANLLVNGSYEASTIHIFGSPPARSTRHLVSGVFDPCQERPPTGIASAGLENGDAERSPSAPNLPLSSLGEQVLRPTTGQELPPSKRKISPKDQQSTNPSLGPIHPSKVSKAAAKKQAPQRQLNMSQNVSSARLPLPSDTEAAKPPSSSPGHPAPRRSKRIQPHIPTTSEDLRSTVSTLSSKRAVRSKPEQNVANSPTARSSARPQGISEKPPAKITQGRARKK